VLLDIYGVGPASVWYLLFGQFKRYDAFEYISPWEQKIYARILFNAEQAAPSAILNEVERRWGRWKMLAAHLLFEDLFWQRKHAPVPWLEELIRL
jgi:3-methyladenine DNA glycosylase/8-oxoguanine DNA glycosylase